LHRTSRCCGSGQAAPLSPIVTRYLVNRRKRRIKRLIRDDLTIQDGLYHKSAYKSCRTGLSEIFFSLLGCHQKFLLDHMRGRRALIWEDELARDSLSS